MALAPPLLAGAAGLLLLAAHPPLQAWWLSFVAPGVLIAALEIEQHVSERSGRRPRLARLGLLAGLAFYGPLLSWLILAAGVVGWGLLVLTQAGWMALLAVLLRPLLRTAWLAPGAALVWTGIDAWRGDWPLGGFGWGAIAYAHVDGSWLLPLARITGARGITLLVVLISVAAYAVVRQATIEVRARGRSSVEEAFTASNRDIALLVGALLLSVLATIEPPAPSGEELDILVAQGNDVRHWEETRPPDHPLAIATNLADLTVAEVARAGPPDLTVWPESSLDRDPWRPGGEPLRVEADRAAREAGRLLTGTSLDGDDPATQRRIAASLLDGHADDELDRYVKRRLVPFGEFVPARRWLDWFPPLQQVPRDAQPGPAAQAMEVVDGVHAAVIICFETLFTDVVRTNLLAADEPAQLLLSLTNDASFGDSAEPAQHLAQTRLRAVETGRWAVHAALSGSSAFVDPAGRTYQDTPLFTQATIRMSVPLVTGRTPYLVTGDVLGWLARAGAVAASAVVLGGWWRSRPQARDRARTPGGTAGAARH